MAAADTIATAASDPPRIASCKPFLFAPPKEAGPVEVLARFELYAVNTINCAAEAIEFTGVLTLKWHDPRQTFDTPVAGVNKKVSRAATSSMSSRQTGIRR